MQTGNFIVSDKEAIFQYTAEKKLALADKPEEKLMVADSWLVQDGRVRALHLHRQRFFSSCIELAGIGPDILNDFWNAATGKLPKTGLWFPRIELAGNTSSPVLQIRIRRAPAIHSMIRLIDYHGEDFRKWPRHKGPDLAKLIAAKKEIVEQGADEAILTTRKGFLLEGLTTSLLWWEGSTLCTTSPSRRVLPGVTSQLLGLIAEQENIPFACRFRKPADLNGCEVWAVNALHGIRRAIEWKKSPFQTSSHIDINHWRQKLDEFSKPV